MQSPQPFRSRNRWPVLVWNAVAILFFATVWAYAAWVASLDACMRVTSLDRAGVINEAKLREAWPNLAVNLRHDLGMWISEKPRKTACFAAVAGAVVAAGNLVLVLLLCRTRRLDRRPGPG